MSGLQVQSAAADYMTDQEQIRLLIMIKFL